MLTFSLAGSPSPGQARYLLPSYTVLLSPAVVHSSSNWRCSWLLYHLQHRTSSLALAYSHQREIVWDPYINICLAERRLYSSMIAVSGKRPKWYERTKLLTLTKDDWDDFLLEYIVVTSVFWKNWLPSCTEWSLPILYFWISPLQTAFLQASTNTTTYFSTFWEGKQ